MSVCKFLTHFVVCAHVIWGNKAAFEENNMPYHRPISPPNVQSIDRVKSLVGLWHSILTRTKLITCCNLQMPLLGLCGSL